MPVSKENILEKVNATHNSAFSAALAYHNDIDGDIALVNVSSTSENSSDGQFERVLLHEFIHYLQVENGGKTSVERTKEMLQYTDEPDFIDERAVLGMLTLGPEQTMTEGQAEYISLNVLDQLKDKSSALTKAHNIVAGKYFIDSFEKEVETFHRVLDMAANVRDKLAEGGELTVDEFFSLDNIDEYSNGFLYVKGKTEQSGWSQKQIIENAPESLEDLRIFN